MEYLDIYDEDENYLGKEDRNIVHRDALWHKTVHCWLYDKEGYIYFQIRKDEGTLYTTASGHVRAGEMVKEAFGREVLEEIGMNINYNDAVMVEVNKFKLDKIKKDGSIFRDRAFANVYVCLIDFDNVEFNYDKDELDGVVRVKAIDTKKLLERKNGKIDGYIIKDGNISMDKIDFKDFLINPGETGIGKYGKILDKVIELTR